MCICAYVYIYRNRATVRPVGISGVTPKDGMPDLWCCGQVAKNQAGGSYSDLGH